MRLLAPPCPELAALLLNHDLKPSQCRGLWYKRDNRGRPKQAHACIKPTHRQRRGAIGQLHPESLCCQCPCRRRRRGPLDDVIPPGRPESPLFMHENLGGT